MNPVEPVDDAMSPAGLRLALVRPLWENLVQEVHNGPLVEDSGEGIVMLIYGGDEGIRLKPVDEKEASSPRQWGEPCLLLDKDVMLT